jgi:hypothetical protein
LAAAQVPEPQRSVTRGRHGPAQGLLEEVEATGEVPFQFDAVVFQLCGQRPVAEIAELIADLLPDLSGSVNAYIR